MAQAPYDSKPLQLERWINDKCIQRAAPPLATCKATSWGYVQRGSLLRTGLLVSFG